MRISLELAAWIRDYLYELESLWRWKKDSIPRYSEEYKKLRQVADEFSKTYEEEGRN